MERKQYEQVGDIHYERPRVGANSPVGSFLLGVCALGLVVFLVIGAITDWHELMAWARVLTPLAVLVLCIAALLALVGSGVYKFHVHRIQLAREQEALQAERDARERAKKSSEVHLRIAERTIPFDERGNAAIWHNEQISCVTGNYSPYPLLTNFHQSSQNDVGIGAGASGLPAKRRLDQPPLVSIIEELTPNTLEFVFGLDPLTGQLARTSLPKAVHIQLLGASGQGKSRQATSILTQLCTRNDTDHLHLALVDCEGETTGPFQGLPHVRYLADEPKEAARTFRGLVNELERRDEKRTLWPVVLIFVEEFLNLRRTMPAEYRDQALEDYTTLALRGRKRGMFLFAIGQTAYTEKAIRDAQMQFLSSMAFAVKPTAARSAGFTNTELLNQLYQERRPGQFLLERPAGDSILLAPYVEPSQVSGLLSGSQVVSSDLVMDEVSNPHESTLKPLEKPTEHALDARALRIRDLLKAGTNQRQIIQEIWGVSSGASYTKAQGELTQISATLI